MRDWLEDEHDEPCLADHRWPMAPTHLLPLERWLWWERLWAEVVMLRRRYKLVPAKDWWEDAAKVEALSALAAWVARYDSGEWDDPPGKLALLYDLERVRQMVRGLEPFDPARDHAAFARFLVDAGCQPPPGGIRPGGPTKYETGVGMAYPMPGELLEQLGLDPRDPADPQWPQDHDALGWGRRLDAGDESEEAGLGERTDEEARSDGR